MSLRLSLLVPLYNEAEIIDRFFTSVLPILEGLPLDWELVCVNDGSRDNSLERLSHWHQQEPRIKVINLSRNFGKERALTAALDLATGDAVIPIDIDLQDPPELIPRMVELWQQGYDVVNAVRRRRDGDSWLKRVSARLFYRTLNAVSDVQIPRDTGDYRLLSRRVCEVLRSMRESHRFMKGLFAWAGFPTTSISFDRAPRSGGSSKWGYWRLWNFALEGITSFSTVPLKLAAYLGLFTALLSLIYASFLIVRTLLFGDPVKGYPSMMAAILFFGGVQLMFIGIIGEYIARIHDEVKGRPIYVIESVLGDLLENAGKGKNG
ncbi:MAG: glycosyltransferase family 2 protein [Gammaproteobacteria bacterium]|nr:glycosyltransferase family 2 protein [Gammaproteobacteria bacterium]